MTPRPYCPRAASAPRRRWCREGSLIETDRLKRSWGQRGKLAFRVKAREACGNTRAEPGAFHRVVLCGVPQNVTDLGLEAAAVSRRPPLQARLYIVFQITNHELCHKQLRQK